MSSTVDSMFVAISLCRGQKYLYQKDGVCERAYIGCVNEIFEISSRLPDRLSYYLLVLAALKSAAQELSLQQKALLASTSRPLASCTSISFTRLAT